MAMGERQLSGSEPSEARSDTGQREVNTDTGYREF